jgi:hypothetical protein
VGIRRRIGLRKGARDELDEVPVALLRRGEKDDVGQLLLRRHAGPAGIGRVGKIDRDLAADDRLNAGFGHLLGEFERAEEIAAVRDRQRGLAITRRQIGERFQLQCAFEQRIGGMDPQMDEADGARDPTHDAILLAPSFGDG